MTPELFTLCLALPVALLLAWAFKRLPDERWQMLAAVPLRKYPDGTWSGVNLTWYGFFSATAYTAAVAVLIILMGAMGTPAAAIAAMAIAVLAICIPAASIIARLVERKRHVLTVGGAAFAGIIAIPAAVVAVQAAARRNTGLGPARTACACRGLHSLLLWGRPGQAGLHQLRLLLRHAPVARSRLDEEAFFAPVVYLFGRDKKDCLCPRA